MKKEVKSKQTKKLAKFTKEQLVNSKTYRHRIDLLEVLLEKDKLYTKKEVNKLIKDFLKGSVK